ncbi:MAG: sigma-54-dependent Fis family transcriptional regulator [Candidatus Firestonebacteria bacterium]|nr:sigma-54-dependent Fis family transcriptional regulator [Candidatus Firestonebacteria bacterium]
MDIHIDDFDFELGDLIGVSARIKEVHSLIKALSRKKINVLITGETGTGKELVAQAIHHNSHRGKSPFITVNCSSIPAGLLESEFFGHEKGSFTDASYQRKGAFELANGGSLLLDEVGDMPVSLQSKILRTIESGVFRRVGGEKEIKVDVRIISSTNKDLVKEILDERFRKDLYYRLNVARVHLPALRERPEDIPFLIKMFIKYYNKKCNKNIKGISPEALSMLKGLHWDGNIRELKNFIEVVISTTTSNIILPEHLLYLTKHDNSPHQKEEVSKVSNLESSNLSTFSQIIDDKMKNITKHTYGLMEEIEKEVIKEVLLKTRWNKTSSSRILGISLNSLKNKIKKYNLQIIHNK